MLPAMTLRAGVYGRESKDKRTSVVDQLTTCERGCERRGWPVAGRYTDGSSASRFRRKLRGQWAQLVADVEAGALDVIVVWEPSRGDRDLETWVPFVAMCRRLGVLIHAESHDRTYDPRNSRDWRSLVEDGLDAAYESEKISARSRRGIAAAVEAGRPHGRVTYGHERIYDASTGAFVQQRPHALHAPIVRSIIGRIAAGDPIKAIVSDLDRSETPAPMGGRWLPQTVRGIALNPAHVGLRRHNGEVSPAGWPALVDAAVFERAGRILRAEDRKRRGPGGLKYLLSCLGTAVACGERLIVKTHSAWEPRYSCDGCGCSSVMMRFADEIVRATLIARLALPDAAALIEPDDSAAAVARAELDALVSRRDDARAYAAMPDGISFAALAVIERELTPLIDAARKRASEIESTPGLAELVGAAQASEARAADLFDGWSLPTRRGVIAAVMRVELLLGARRLTRWSSDDERRAVAFERLRLTPLTPVAARRRAARTGRSAAR